VETPKRHADEDFAQILQRLKDTHGVSDSEIARRTGVHVSTVNSWVHRKRTPKNEAIQALHDAFPDFSVHDLSEAAGRKAPGPLSPEAKDRIMALIEGLTKDQQEMLEIQARALNESNRSRP
jgi:DNA-directed RNA polymerase specialized sigma24 family protein